MTKLYYNKSKRKAYVNIKNKNSFPFDRDIKSNYVVAIEEGDMEFYEPFNTKKEAELYIKNNFHARGKH